MDIPRQSGIVAGGGTIVMRIHVLLPVFFFLALCARDVSAYTPPSALEVFRLLPVTIFENTPEGLGDEEKQTLIENGRTSLWRLISIDADELRAESYPLEGSSVTVRLFHGPDKTVAAQGAETRDACAVELWLHDAQKRLVPYPVPPDPALRDFFAAGKKPPAGFDHSIRICLAGDVLRAWPLFFNAEGAADLPLDNAVIYRWTGGDFEKAALPLEVLEKKTQRTAK